MKMSVREARAQFAAAIAAAERGERVTITRNGKAVAEIAPPSGLTQSTEAHETVDDILARLARIRTDLGISTRSGSPADGEAWIEDHRKWRHEVLGAAYYDDPEPVARP